MRRGAHGKGEREDSSEAPPGEKEEAAAPAPAPAPAPASKGGRGRQGKGESAGQRTKSKASLLNEEPAPERAGEAALPSGRKASLKKHESASQAREAKRLEADVDPLQKPSASPGEPGCAVPRNGPGRAGRRRVAVPPPPSPLPLEGDSRPPGKEIARRGRGSRPKKKEVAPQGAESESAEERAGPAEKKLASQLRQQERALRGQGTEAGAAKQGALPKTRPVPEGEGNRGESRLSGPDPPEPPLDQRSPRVLKPVLERLKLAREERAKASQLVNRTRDTVVAAIKKSPYFHDIEPLGAGSYYERVKVCSPNEFDILIKMPGLRFELEPCDVSGSCGAFYYIKMKRNPGKGNLAKFIENERLSSSRMVLELTKIIKEGIKETEDVKVSTKRPGCPAVTLVIGKEPSVITVDIVLGVEFQYIYWYNSTKNGLDIERWLGTKEKQELLREPLYLVPKNIKEGRSFIDNTWRLSFSVIEKKILNNHGFAKTCCEKKGSPCCRKHCLKLLKYLLEQLKTKHKNKNLFNKFCSYQVKTTFLHACVKWPRDEEWLIANLDECFNRLLDYFLDCLREANLPHFFIPSYNFFCNEKIEKAKCNALMKVIETERNNNFPIFSL